MRIGIITEGGEGIGNGHLARTTALADGFSTMGCKVHFLISGINISYPFERPYSIEFLNWHKKNAIKKLNKDFDIAIVDSYKANQDTLHRLNKMDFLTVYLTDPVLNYPPNGHVFFPAAYSKDFEDQFKSCRKYFGGTEYILFTKELWNRPKIKIMQNLKSVGVSLGSVTDVYLAKVIDCLQNTLTQIHELIIFGHSEIQFPHSTIRIEPTGLLNKEEYVKRIQNVDFLVTNGGQSLNEAILLGIPTLSIVCADNQRNNVVFWNKYECTIGMDVRNKLKKTELITNLKKLSLYQNRLKLSSTSSSSMDHYGSLRAAWKILDWKNQN